MATIKKVKKAQAGMTMKQLIKKYPGIDTTSRGDVRGSEMNSGAPKKVLDKYNDTYNAFEKKSKEAPKAKPAKKSMKMGGKVKKAQNGTTSKKEDRQARNIKTAKQRFDASTNPPYNRDKVDFPVKGVTLRQNVDTTGYAAGRKFFPYKNQLESSEGGPRVEKKPRYGVASRRLIDIAFANDKKKSAPKNKMGGKISKKK